MRALGIGGDVVVTSTGFFFFMCRCDEKKEEGELTMKTKFDEKLKFKI